MDLKNTLVNLIDLALRQDDRLSNLLRSHAAYTVVLPWCNNSTLFVCLRPDLKENKSPTALLIFFF